MAYLVCTNHCQINWPQWTCPVGLVSIVLLLKKRTRILRNLSTTKHSWNFASWFFPSLFHPIRSNEYGTTTSRTISQNHISVFVFIIIPLTHAIVEWNCHQWHQNKSTDNMNVTLWWISSVAFSQYCRTIRLWNCSAYLYSLSFHSSYRLNLTVSIQIKWKNHDYFHSCILKLKKKTNFNLPLCIAKTLTECHQSAPQLVSSFYGSERNVFTFKFTIALMSKRFRESFSFLCIDVMFHEEEQNIISCRTSSSKWSDSKLTGKHRQKSAKNKLSSTKLC